MYWKMVYYVVLRNLSPQIRKLAARQPKFPPSLECGSDFPDTDGRDSTGECVSVETVTNNSVDNAALLARGMDILQALLQEIAQLRK